MQAFNILIPYLHQPFMVIIFSKVSDCQVIVAGNLTMEHSYFPIWINVWRVPTQSYVTILLHLNNRCRMCIMFTKVAVLPSIMTSSANHFFNPTGVLISVHTALPDRVFNSYSSSIFRLIFKFYLFFNTIINPLLPCHQPASPCRWHPIVLQTNISYDASSRWLQCKQA